MAVSWFEDSLTGFSGAFANGVVQADGGTAIGIDQALSNNAAAEYYAGAGAAIAASAGLAGSDPW
jgi:hypothetical protein